MLQSVEGIYREGKIELVEPPSDVRDDTRVIVTFLGSSYIELKPRGIDQEQAAHLRSRLGVFIEEWECPEMDIYDDYDGAKPGL